MEFIRENIKLLHISWTQLARQRVTEKLMLSKGSHGSCRNRISQMELQIIFYRGITDCHKDTNIHFMVSVLLISIDYMNGGRDGMSD